MTVFTESRRPGEFLVSEAGGARSRGTVAVTVGADTTLQPGMVLGKITATGKYVPYDEAAVDGSETAVAVLWGRLDNETAGAQGCDRGGDRGEEGDDRRRGGAARGGRQRGDEPGDS